MRLAILLLAAGASRRFGMADKLLADLNGRPLCAHTATALRTAMPASPMVAVVPVGATALRAALADHVDTFAENPDAAEGVASSLRCGLAALPEDLDGVLISQADMPGLTAEFISGLVAAFEAGDRARVVYPRDAHGRQRTPVIWPRHDFGTLRGLTGDRGAKNLIAAADSEGRTCPVDLAPGSDDVLTDIDTPEALAQFKS